MRFDVLFEDHSVPTIEEIKLKIQTLFHYLENEYTTSPKRPLHTSFSHVQHRGDFRIMGEEVEPGISLIYSTRIPFRSTRNAPGSRSYRSQFPEYVRSPTKYLTASIYIPEADDEDLYYEVMITVDREIGQRDVFERLSEDVIERSPGYSKKNANEFATDLGTSVARALDQYLRSR